MRISCFFVVVSSVALLSLTSCGAGSAIGGIFEPPPTEITVSSISGRDGYVSSPNSGATGSAIPGVIRVGDSFLAWSRRGFVSFDTALVPAGAEIVEARMYLSQDAITGAPYALGPDMEVDHVHLGATLDVADWGAAPLAPSIGILSSSPALGARSVDVTAAVQVDKNAGRIRSEFRMRFPTEKSLNLTADTATFNDADDGTGSGVVPFLVIRYRD